MSKPLRLIIALAAVVQLSACKPDSETVVSKTEQPDTEIVKADITVYKSPSCGCCKEWATYLEEEGFNVTSIDHEDVDSIKVKLGLPSPELKSCHTAIVDDYLIEGHVPANDIKRLLREQPTHLKGLSAPGMPMNSPGMASRTPKDYAVISFTESGETAVYSQY